MLKSHPTNIVFVTVFIACSTLLADSDSTTSPIDKSLNKTNKPSTSLTNIHKCEITKAFDSGYVDLTFQGLDNGDNLLLKLKNRLNVGLKITLIGGETVFFPSSNNKIQFTLSRNKLLALQPNGSDSIIVQQSGSQRVVSGSMTASKTLRGIESSYSDFSIGAAKAK